MYCEFYQLTERPFNVTPDPKFLYLNARYREAIASLSYGITQRKGFITLIGEAGTGKTTLLKRLLEDLDPKTKTVFIFNTNVTFEEILEYIFAEFDLPVHNGKKLYMLQRLNSFLLDELRSGGNVALLIDEAQDLEFSVLEDLRLLSNLETAKEKILQIVLSGQPELGQKLSNPVLRQLRQRISINCRLLPLSRDEISEYLQYRLQAAGSPDLKLFTREAEDQIYHFSRGVPRLVNVVCDNALVIGYALGKKRIGADIIKEAAADLLPIEPEEKPREETHPAPVTSPATLGRQGRPWKGRAAVIGLVLAGVVGGSLSILRTTADSVPEQSEIARAPQVQVIQPGSHAAVAGMQPSEPEVRASDIPPEPGGQIEGASGGIPAGILELRDPRQEARRHRISEVRDEPEPLDPPAVVPDALEPNSGLRDVRAAAVPLEDPAPAGEAIVDRDHVSRAGEHHASATDLAPVRKPASETDGAPTGAAAVVKPPEETSPAADLAPDQAKAERASAARAFLTAAAPDASRKLQQPAAPARPAAPQLEVVHEEPLEAASIDVASAAVPAVDADRRSDEVGLRLEGMRYARIRVQEGDSISTIAVRRYGQASATILDLVKLANPSLKDIDLIVVGQTIRLPQLEGGFPILDEGGERYSLLIFSTGDARRANRLRDELRSRGFEAQVTGGDLGAGKPLRRVVVSGFRSREEVLEAGKRLQRLFREDSRIAELGRTTG